MPNSFSINFNYNLNISGTFLCSISCWGTLSHNFCSTFDFPAILSFGKLLTISLGGPLVEYLHLTQMPLVHITEGSKEFSQSCQLFIRREAAKPDVPGGGWGGGGWRLQHPILCVN